MRNVNLMRILTIIAIMLIFSVNFKAKSNGNESQYQLINNANDTLSYDNTSNYAINSEKIYSVYDTNNNLIMEHQNICKGDLIIDKNFNQFVIYEVDDENNIAYSRFEKSIAKPNVTKNLTNNVTNKDINKKIGLYMSHNDESYENGDGYSSIYGAGGIHDIAKSLNSYLASYNINTYFDETLHIPHDSYAYARSKETASKLLKNDLDAIFDIHRDGASRSTYVKNVDGVERCKVRIVVGQANPNKEENLQFALDLMSVAENICPWLFLDIYYASGHYNQSLKNTSLLFEMGSHLVEKELVLKTVPYLANVINSTLYKTTIDDNGNLTINSNNLNENTIANHYKSYNNNNVVLGIILLCLLLIPMIVIIIKSIKKNKYLS